MNDGDEKLAELASNLRQNPRQCPNCGSQEIARLDQDALVVGKRQCRLCGCLWEPPWAKFTCWSALVLASLFGAVAVRGVIDDYPGYWNGDFMRQLENVGSVREFLRLIIAPVALILLGLVVFQCVAVLRGKKGQGRILERGRQSGGQPAE